MWWVTTDVAVSVCGRSGLWPFRFVAVSVCGRFGLWPFRSVTVPVCGRFGLWPFQFVAVPVCGRSGLWPFRFVAVSVVAVSVCGRYDLLPLIVPGEITRRTWVWFPLGMNYQFVIIKIWLFHEETFSYRNWYICNTQLVYIFDLKMLTHEMSMMMQWFSEVMKLKVPFP